MPVPFLLHPRGFGFLQESLRRQDVAAAQGRCVSSAECSPKPFPSGGIHCRTGVANVRDADVCQPCELEVSARFSSGEMSIHGKAEALGKMCFGRAKLRG